MTNCKTKTNFKLKTLSPTKLSATRLRTTGFIEPQSAAALRNVDQEVARAATIRETENIPAETPSRVQLSGLKGLRTYPVRQVRRTFRVRPALLSFLERLPFEGNGVSGLSNSLSSVRPFTEPFHIDIEDGRYVERQRLRKQQSSYDSESERPS